MARSAAARAEQAADALETYLRARPRRSENGGTAADGTVAGTLGIGMRPGGAVASDVPTAALHGAPTEPTAPSHQELDGGAPVTDLAPLKVPHTDWLYHRLTVSGPVHDLSGFRTAAAGAGTIPWQLDAERMEEDFFLLLATRGASAISAAGARILAGQVRAAMERRHALAVAQVGHSTACPLDLHALVPVPPPILQLGPDHPQALAWLWQHWGTTQPLRHITLDPNDGTRRPPPPGGAVLRLRFWAADWTPWRALARIRQRWPDLTLDVRPSYDDPA